MAKRKRKAKGYPEHTCNMVADREVTIERETLPPVTLVFFKCDLCGAVSVSTYRGIAASESYLAKQRAGACQKPQDSHKWQPGQSVMF